MLVNRSKTRELISLRSSNTVDGHTQNDPLLAPLRGDGDMAAFVTRFKTIWARRMSSPRAMKPWATCTSSTCPRCSTNGAGKSWK